MIFSFYKNTFYSLSIIYDTYYCVKVNLVVSQSSPQSTLSIHDYSNSSIILMIYMATWERNKNTNVTLFINRVNLIDLNVIKVSPLHCSHALQNWDLGEWKERCLLFGKGTILSWVSLQLFLKTECIMERATY